MRWTSGSMDAKLVQPRISAGQEHGARVAVVGVGQVVAETHHQLDLDLLEHGGEQLGFVGELVVFAALLTPASLAMRSVPTAAYPCSVNSRRAALTRARRVVAERSAWVRRVIDHRLTSIQAVRMLPDSLSANFVCIRKRVRHADRHAATRESCLPGGRVAPAADRPAGGLRSWDPRRQQVVERGCLACSPPTACAPSPPTSRSDQHARPVHAACRSVATRHCTAGDRTSSTALDLSDVTLVGNDTGGAICQYLVDTDRSRIGRLVLTNCDCFEQFPPPSLQRFVELRAASRSPRRSRLRRCARRRSATDGSATARLPASTTRR